MRRRTLAPLVPFMAAAATAALLGTASPAAAESPIGAWEPAPSAPWSFPAGARCDFPVHGSPVVDEVVRRTVAVREDGTQVFEYKGALVIRVVNSTTGATYDADAGGRALVEVHPDHSQKWYVIGPILAGFAEYGGNLARGLYTPDGVYTLDVSPTGYKTLTFLHGSADALCERVG
ncbi:hypothetical protein [Streptomyces sp. NPDC048623]|uniref:hypothetical protein n=1 Tax=Streptomyces sp. NPDC048623 TaxID=3155761 RepID=UPI003420ADFF